MDNRQVESFFTELGSISTEMSKTARTFGPVSRAKVHSKKLLEKAFQKTPKPLLFATLGGGLAANKASNAEKHERLADERAKLDPETAKALRKKRMKKLYIPSVVAGTVGGAMLPSTAKSLARALKGPATREAKKAVRPIAEEAGKGFARGVPGGFVEGVKNLFKRKK